MVRRDDPNTVCYTRVLSVARIENPKVSLHGGPTGFDCLPWEVLSEKPKLFTESELKHLATSSGSEDPTESFAFFRLVSPDGDQGFPGKLLVEAHIALVSPGQQERKYRLPGEPVKAHEEFDLGSVVIVYRAKLGRFSRLNKAVSQAKSRIIRFQTYHRWFRCSRVWMELPLMRVMPYMHRAAT